MRTLSLVIGGIAVLTGAVWILQGTGLLPGSFMTGQRMWLIIGIIVGLVGLALAYNGIRKPAKS
jgi:hypothetical protein